MNTAEALVRCLENEGVRYIFGIPGEENLAVMEALKKSSIRFITVRHEQGAAFMADVVGRLTGKAGVCMSTLGPGATNLITGVADANLDGAPLIAISGQVETARSQLTSHQYVNLVELFEPITKRSKMVVNPGSINEIVRIAFKYAESEKPGAGFIDLPCDIAQLEVPEISAAPLRHSAPHIELADVGSVERAASLIFMAKNPIVLAGHSAVRSRAAAALTEFAETLHIPVINTMMAKGIIPFDSPYSMWTIGLPQKDYQNVLIDEADLVITVGYDIVEYAPIKWNQNRSHKILNIDSRACHVNKLFQPETEVMGDISSSLRSIMLRCSPKEEPKRPLAIRVVMAAEQERAAGDVSFPMKPQKILADIRSVLGPHDILLSDVGAHKMWIARHYNCYEPNTCIISNGFATMGIGLPGAIAAKLTYPDRKVVTVTGDGGFLMNLQELETAVRIGTAFVVLIFHDDSYGLIKWKQMERYHSSCYVDFSNPDFVMLAESFHCKGYRIHKAEELATVLREALKQKVPAIIDCPVDYGENMRLSRRLKGLISQLQSREPEG